jgi:DNA-binding transcriptional LysR family regulator
LWGPRNSWTFSRIGSGQKESIDFEPHLSINDYSEMASLLLSGAGIGEIPPMVQPDLLQNGGLVEVMPQWRFQPVKMSIVHLGNRYVSRAVRLFKDVAAEFIPTLVPKLSAA